MQIWQKVEQRDSERCDTPVQWSEAREYIRDDQRAKRRKARRQPSALGEIYFVQIDSLIKVGWTSKLADRVRSYGPNAELLANYPATRADEVLLHQQLAPARYRGREWYEDSPIVRDYIARAIQTHGPPRFAAINWSAPKGPTARPKRSR